ncbi:hypothetical protein H7X64_03440 [Armatimonadetes bacterium]|nr:hypothetical protein [bacterium]
MSNSDASEENVKSPFTNGNDGYEEYRKKEKMKKKEIPPITIEHHMKNVNENAGIDENDNYIHRRMQDQEYRKKEKVENKNDPEKEGLNTVIGHSKYTVGGESKEVPASALDENDNFVHRRELNQPKQMKRVERRSKDAPVDLKTH